MSKCVITLFSILSNAIRFCLLIIQWTTRQTNVAVVTTRHPAGTYIYIYTVACTIMLNIVLYIANQHLTEGFHVTFLTSSYLAMR